MGEIPRSAVTRVVLLVIGVWEGVGKVRCGTHLARPAGGDALHQGTPPKLAPATEVVLVTSQNYYQLLLFPVMNLCCYYQPGKVVTSSSATRW